MIPKLLDYLNQTILVSMPAVHSDARCRSYTLRGVEMQGLWLESEELVGHLTPGESGKSIDAKTPVFVPFSQVACVLFPNKSYQKVAGLPGELLEQLRSKSAVGHSPHEGSQRHGREAEPRAREPEKDHREADKRGREAEKHGREPEAKKKPRK